MDYHIAADNSMNFESISDFKECLIRGGEVEFQWKGVNYSIAGYDKYDIGVYNQENTTMSYDTPDEVLEYMIGSDRLRDVITQVTVLDRTI